MTFLVSAEPSIGLVCPDLHSPRGGLGRAMRVMADALEEASMHVIDLGMRTKRFPGDHLAQAGLLPFVLRRRVRRAGPSLLLAPVGPGGVLFAKRPAAIPFCAVVYHTYLQQSRLVPVQRWKSVLVPLECRTLSYAEKILCFARETEQILTDDYALSSDNIILLPQILDPSAWPVMQRKEEGLCVCVARLEARKGVPTLLKAWPHVESQNADAHLVIVGDGVQRRSVDRLIHSCKRVIRIPSLPHAELSALVARAELSLCPSYLEGFGLAAAEAMLAGTAVIGSDVDGLQSLLGHGEFGKLVGVGDTDAWASAILELLRDAEMRNAFTLRAQKMMSSRFDPAQAKKAFVSAVQSLAGDA